MESLPPAIYTFQNFILDGQEKLLFDGTDTIPLTPKAFDLLQLLVENSGKILSKEQIMATVWPDSFVEENNLAQNISVLRKALGEGHQGAKFIETVPKRGYRFIAPVQHGSGADESWSVVEKTTTRIRITEEVDDSEDIQSLKLPRPETHYAKSGDVNIAYQVVGSGEVDIVFVMGWVSHLEYFWAQPQFAWFLSRLASFSRLILFDKRGTGLSDRVPNDQLPTLEQRMDDVRAVMDAVGSQKAVLLGVSEGGPMCSLFAATYPEKTNALIMIGTYAKRIRDEDYPWAPSLEQREAFYDLMLRDWGKPVGIEERAPSMANDSAFRDWWATYLRMGASPGAAVSLTKMNAEIDVRHVLPSIRVPSMVVHRSGDLCLKVEEGRYVASKIPGCKFVELPGIDHLPFVGDQDEILHSIEEFLTGVSPEEEHDRVLATVMSVKAVEPGGARVELGDITNEIVRRNLGLFKGREIRTDSEGFLTVFDGPARAIKCANAVNESASASGILLRIGLHTGECDVVGGAYHGVAVDLARHIADEAGVSEVIVSRTVKDLVAGSGLEFQEKGLRSFPAVQGDWRIFKALVP